MRQGLPSTPSPTRHWTTPDGLRLAGDSWGDPNRQLVILLHGGGQTRHAWKGAGEALARAGYHSVAVDARGHGDSQWDPAGAYGPDAMVDDLVVVAENLGRRRPVLVGASMGGSTSLLAVGEGRIDAAAMVLVDVAPRMEPQGVERIRAFMSQRPEGFGSLDEVADAVAGYRPGRPRPRTLDGLAKNVRVGTNGRYHWHWDPGFLEANGDLDALQRRLEACAGRLTTPTLLVHGALSDVLTDRGASAFLAACPNAEYANVAHAAHMVAGDRNDEFVDAVLGFLARTVPADGGAADGGGPP
ncbi:MAG: alpha/beta hydrolase [Pseudonocardia sp.]|uniref:alpha/beta fold hydrolase n=1 Tax=unclassified Pseudonocardia TaxID=2619320 RepID=UPI000869143E|nr:MULTISPECIES: alpha/beta hydrolase [unclassified Pseudonocardia]MBN9109425.1 alpha/beta hydrolase [Pseudonocardia sp.]ODU29936.1 MAG: alpha/beta hydrolase [Pseudonocardia sp. SCN 72-51]ODV08126.1 MAG: alpha/beta hydrolase [Pseudonocardia sp. SCN 73-27]